MKRFFLVLLLSVLTGPALAWNAAGHRIVAAIAWQQMSAATRTAVGDLLARHPDYPRWLVKAQDQPAYTAFLEASTWPDDIRHDPRFSDDSADPKDLMASSFRDTLRHLDWHYVDVDSRGQPVKGRLDRQIERLGGILHANHVSEEERAYALPWLIHLVGDIHQPLHVGHHDDEGGNRFEIENPLNARLPFTNLHTWWDDLPGPPWLRGSRLERVKDSLHGRYDKPIQGDVTLWREESRQLALHSAYPRSSGSLLPQITPEFLAASRSIANRRLHDAGIRLGRLLEQSLSSVPRETD